MAKPNTTTNKSGKKRSSSDYSIERFMLLCTDICSRVRLPGFILIAIVTFVFSFASIKQKHDIIDEWILFRNNSNAQPFTITIIIFAVIIYIVEAVTFAKIRQLDQTEIKRLAKYKKEYQEEVLGQELKTSKL